MNKELLESQISTLPILQYGFIQTNELTFSEQVRFICETECPMYGNTWACPPAVGKVAECRRKCLEYEEALMLVTVEEVSDIDNFEESLATRKKHEQITREVRKFVDEQAKSSFVLSTESCTYCSKCTYPGQPCRYPGKMFPCVESYGINVTEIAEKYNIPFYYGRDAVTWFSFIFFR
jgi:predicted metal-binding protein